MNRMGSDSRKGRTSRTGKSRSSSKRSNGTSRLRQRKRKSSAKRSSGNGTASGWSRHGTALPSWTDLEPQNQRRRDTSDDSFLESVSTVRFAVLVLALAGAFTLYVGHVHATKDLLSQVQEARQENQRLHLKRNRLKGAFDRKTSPSVIYERAREMGLRASVTYGPSISVD